MNAFEIQRKQPHIYFLWEVQQLDLDSLQVLVYLRRSSELVATVKEASY